MTACRLASRGTEAYEGLYCKQMVMPVCPDLGHRNFPVEGLADSGWRIRTVLGPSWLVDFVRLMVPVVVSLLAGCSVLALADRRDAGGIGSAFPVCVVAPTLVPEQGTGQFENVVLTGGEAMYSHARSSVHSRKLNRHSEDCCIETPRRRCADCHVDRSGFGWQTVSPVSSVESQRWAVIVCYSPLCYLRATSIRSHWRRRDVVCACAVEFWMVGDGGQRPFVYSGRHSHHCQRLLRKELVVAATYLMRPVEAECSGKLTRLFCSPPREDPRWGNV